MRIPRQIYPEKHTNWLPDGAGLWRYVPLRTLFYYLSGSVFIPSVEKLRQADPFEGEFHFESWYFDEAMQGRYGKEFSDLRAWMFREHCTSREQQDIVHNGENSEFAARLFEKRYFQFVRKTRFAWCWLFSDFESAAMWSVYRNQGAAVATTVGQLCQTFLKKERDFVFGRMRYIHVDQGAIRDLDPEDPEDPHDPPFVLQPHFLKRREYESEKEVRFVTTGPENRHGGGICVGGIDPNAWIQKIRLWPMMSSSEETACKKAIDLVAPGIHCQRSELMISDERFAAELRCMELAEQQWKDGTDGIPAALKQVN